MKSLFTPMTGLFVVAWLISSGLAAEELQIRLDRANISVHSNGKIAHTALRPESGCHSDNNQFWGTYEIGNVNHDTRELHNFRFYELNQLMFTMAMAPGSEMYISNNGYIVFINMLMQHQNQILLLFYSPRGEQLFSISLATATLFGFSEEGNHFAIGNAEGLRIISLPDGAEQLYPPADNFDISPDGRSLAIARKDILRFFRDGEEIQRIKTGFLYTRAIKILPAENRVAVIDKHNLNIYNLHNAALFLNERAGMNRSWRALDRLDELLIAGVHQRSDGESQGILKVYAPGGMLIAEHRSAVKSFQTFAADQALQPSTSGYDEIPWPFVPFDSMHTVWNYYEQHMGLGGGSSYMHQGLDMITPINEPTYAVADGVTKLVLTLGGAIYWRIATSPTQEPGFSRGWLYAHLVEESIQFDVGDTVTVHDYLGDIIAWTSEWGHIHFVEIEDSGSVWYYDDNEWGITYNPLNSLRSNQDDTAPIIEPVFDDSKFAFCLNESSVYLDPDSLYGEIDIITKVVDYIGDSEWQQPAYECYYWIKSLDDSGTGSGIVFPRTLGQRLNHTYDQYNSGYYTLYAPLIYKLDELLTATSWMETERNFYHLLTNNNGDTLLDLSETDLAFNTGNYPDGAYRVFIEVRDQYQNTTVDSMDVQFRNLVTAIGDEPLRLPQNTELFQNYPNPFNPTTDFGFRISDFGLVRIKVYDIEGRLVRTVVDKNLAPGSYTAQWDGTDIHNKPVASGVYFYQLTSGNLKARMSNELTHTKKMILMR